MSRKIGIVTFHRALNYGAVLQTYALQQFMLNNLIENEVIDYFSPSIEKCYRPFNITNKKYIRGIARGFLFGGTIRKKRKNFNQFLEQSVLLSNRSYNTEDLKDLKKEYKLFLTGSDQVWSPSSAGFDEAYFLTFADDKQKYSYAASLGTNTLPSQYIDAYTQRLQNFQGISVREKEANTLLNQYIKNPIEVHIDPTFLLNKMDWSKICKNPKETNYILLFNVENPIENIQYAKKLACNYNKKIIYINDRTVKKEKDILYVEAPSPNEFLGYFMNADIVVTNSFHGTAFSIIFQKDFVVELDNKKARNIRAENLLKELGLANQTLDYHKAKDLQTGIINWDLVKGKIEKQQNNSRTYLLGIQN